MVEDKVIGPFTVKQFLFLGAGAGIILFARTFFQPFIFYPLSFMIAVLAGGLAFLKVGGQPMPRVVKNAILFAFRPRLYTWKRAEMRPQKPEVMPKKETLVQKIPTVSESKISDLAWSLDIKTRRE